MAANQQPSMFTTKANMLFDMYFDRYSNQPAQFCVLRTQVTKPEQLKGKRSCVDFKRYNGMDIISVNELDLQVIIKKEKTSNIQEIKWGEIMDGREKKRYINIIMKNQKQPLNFYGNVKDMELWYDALRRINTGYNCALETETGKNMIKELEFGLEMTQEHEYYVPEVPPPPANVDF